MTTTFKMPEKTHFPVDSRMGHTDEAIYTADQLRQPIADALARRDFIVRNNAEDAFRDLVDTGTGVHQVNPTQLEISKAVSAALACSLMPGAIFPKAAAPDPKESV